MKENSSSRYLPKERNFLEQRPKEIRAYSKNKKTFTHLPDPVKDPIVANNIAYMEFDYTEDSDLE